MPTLDELLVVPTKAQLRALALLQLQGIGWVKHAGVGSGSLTLSGTPTGDFDLIAKVSVGGALGIAQVVWSTDGGVSFPFGPTTITTAPFVFAGTGVTGQWANGAGTSFILGDTYAADLRKLGFPVTAWQPLSTPLALIENDAEALADLYTLVKSLAEGGFIDLAQGGWADLLAQQRYGLPRLTGQVATGLVRMTAASGAGPFTKAAGDVTVISTGGLKYSNTAGFTLNPGTSLDVSFRAEASGAQYNVGNGSIATLVTSMPGVTINNIDQGTGTWLTLQGTDPETDGQLAIRCKARWPALGKGVPKDNYGQWAREASAVVVKTTARVGTVAGTVQLLIAGNSGGVSAGVVTAVDTYIKPRAPLCVSCLVASATPVSVNVNATLYCAIGTGVQAQRESGAALAALIADNPIGGTVYLTAIIEALMLGTGVRNVVVATPVADVILSSDQVLGLTSTLTVIEV